MKLYLPLLLTLGLMTANAFAQQQVFKGATLYDGNGGEPIANSVVVVEQGTISCVGTDCAIPESAEIIDVSGKFLTPGLVDSHVHYAASGWFDTRRIFPMLREVYDLDKAQDYLRQNSAELDRSYLCSGVTAVFDTGSFPWTIALEETSVGSVEKPRFVASGQLITHDTHPAGKDVLRYQKYENTREFLPMGSDEEALGSVAAIAASGSSAVKVWFTPPAPQQADELRDRLSVIGNAAHRNKLLFIVHVETLKDAKVAIRAGADVLVHGVDSTLVDDEFIKLVTENNVVYQTTMTVLLDGVTILDLMNGDAPHFDDPNYCISPRTRQLVRDGYEKLHGPFSQNFGPAQRQALILSTGANIFRAQHNLKRLLEEGGTIAAATDAGNPQYYHGPSIYGEMELIQAAGVPAREVIVMATKNGAKAMGLEGTLGTVEVGKNADLVVLAEDPGKDVAAFRSITHVMRFGKLHSIADLSYASEKAVD
ncbi:amidohydrolase family protein [Pseudidiomarina sp.]|uniref:amidohydrolase family protein n=1 Tax=Pseudidiomarina sp. TaxID=2081707 RepID=UPI003A9798E1